VPRTTLGSLSCLLHLRCRQTLLAFPLPAIAPRWRPFPDFPSCSGYCPGSPKHASRSTLAAGGVTGAGLWWKTPLSFTANGPLFPLVDPLLPTASSTPLRSKKATPTHVPYGPSHLLSEIRTGFFFQFFPSSPSWRLLRPLRVVSPFFGRGTMGEFP